MEGSRSDHDRTFPRDFTIIFLCLTRTARIWECLRCVGAAMGLIGRHFLDKTSVLSYDCELQQENVGLGWHTYLLLFGEISSKSYIFGFHCSTKQNSIHNYCFISNLNTRFYFLGIKNICKTQLLYPVI